MSETTKETYAKKTEGNPEKSPTSILDVLGTKKIAELATGEESFSEDENPDEPSEYVTTIAEEEEDTYSEDSDTTISDVESESSTECDEYEFLTCNDGERQLLTSQKCDLIAITDSSESNEDEVEIYDVDDSGKLIKSVDKNIDGEETNEEISILDTKLTGTSLEQSPKVTSIENSEIQQSTEKKRLPSIIVHENLDVKKIKDASLRDLISLLADSFYTSKRKGDFSMNSSIDCCAKEDKTVEEIENHKRAKKKRLSRSSSAAEISKSNEDEVELYKVDDSEEMIKNVDESIEALSDGEEMNEEVFIQETKLASSLIENPEIQQSTEKKKLPSIDKDAPLREPISHLADSFYTSKRKGDVSMNPFIECCAKEDDKTGKEIENHKRAKKRKLSRSSSSTADISKSVDSEDNVNVEEEHIEEKTSKKRGKKRKLSKSMDNLDQIETKKTDIEKKMAHLDNLIGKLVKDKKNEWIVKPSTNMNNSWITEVAHTKTSTSGSTSTFNKKKKTACKTDIARVKPSTSALHTKGKAGHKAGKVNSKDFRSPILNSDPSRVQRIKAKALSKKKGKG